jgi:hypothetical protein
MHLNDKDVLSTVSVDKRTFSRLHMQEFLHDKKKAKLTFFFLLVVLRGHMNQQEKKF